VASIENFSIQDITHALLFPVTKALSDGSSTSDVLWEGSPWVTPGLIGVTLEAVALVVFLTWLELAVLKVGSFYPFAATYVIVGVLWLVGAARLELLKLSNHYALRESSLEIRHGIVGKRIFTVSASGFSDLGDQDAHRPDTQHGGHRRRDQQRQGHRADQGPRPDEGCLHDKTGDDSPAGEGPARVGR
jgi:hypothetical protein